MNEPAPERHTEDLFGRGSGTIEEGHFLAGPESRRSELVRTLRIAWEFIRVQSARTKFGLEWESKPSWLLGEHGRARPSKEGSS